MFQRILLPLDGSARAERAIPAAARLARASNGSLILVRVVDKTSDFFLAAQPTLAQHILKEDFAQAEQYLADIADSAELQDICLETAVRFGSVVPTILALAHDCEADLIVMCSHGYSGVMRRIMGSVAEQLARYAPVPLLVLRENGPLPGEKREDRLLRALVPLDGSKLAEAALAPTAHLLTALADHDQAQHVLHLLRVVQPVMANSEPGGMLTESERAKRYLNEMAGQMRGGVVAPIAVQPEFDVTWSVAVDTYVVETLTEASSQEAEVLGDYDLIALAATEREGVQRWAMGSITEHLLLDTSFPLFIVPAQRQKG